MEIKGAFVHGHVNQSVSLSLAELLHEFPRVELAAVNRCSGNSRGFLAPRLSGTNGPTAPWAMLCGPAYACATC
jgi:DMSO/TMAO reductase YedYZ molybdopterin-dependent catalytic subunit